MEPQEGFEPSTYRLQGGCTTSCAIRANLEQYKGLEPSPSAWKADMLAIEHQYCKFGQGDGTRTRNLSVDSRMH